MRIRPIKTAIIAVLLTTGMARAQNMTFTIDPILSQFTLPVTTLLMGTPLATSAQGAGSLVTGFGGSILADVTGSTIQFLPGSLLSALNSGSWLPGNDYAAGDYLTASDPANYGMVTDLRSLGFSSTEPSAVRDLQISLVIGTPVSLTGGVFDEGGITTDYTDGTVFYSVGGYPPVTDLTTVTPNPTQSSASPATVTTLGNETTLVMPFAMHSEYYVNMLLVQQDYAGTLYGTYSIPEPSTLALLLLGGPAMAGLARRRRGPQANNE